MAASPGNGFRDVNSLMIEISLHLVEPVVVTSITSSVIPGLHTVGVTSTVGMYVGAQVVIEGSTYSEAYGAGGYDIGGYGGEIPAVITITAFDPVGLTMTAAFPQAYSSGAIVQGGTFPTQQPTDPLFTQSEIMGYIARAQNEFLARVPLVLGFFYQNILIGQVYQTLPATAIELERVALSTADLGFGDGGYGDGGFGGEPYPPTSPLPVFTRLYEVSQQQISMADPNWFYNTGEVNPTKWFEDRTGVYGWGIAGVPQANQSVELICSIRDDEVMSLVDHFLVPDLFIHAIKFRALAYIWNKDGEQRSPGMASLMMKRFERLVMISDRYLRNMIDSST